MYGVTPTHARQPDRTTACLYTVYDRGVKRVQKFLLCVACPKIDEYLSSLVDKRGLPVSGSGRYTYLSSNCGSGVMVTSAQVTCRSAALNLRPPTVLLRHCSETKALSNIPASDGCISQGLVRPSAACMSIAGEFLRSSRCTLQRVRHLEVHFPSRRISP